MFSLLTALLLILLSACGPDATPLPVIQTPTPTSPPVATEVPPIRYAIPANIIDFVPDLNLLSSAAQVEPLAETVDLSLLGNRYDIVSTYGEYTGWIRSEVTPQVMLVINPAADPLTPQTADLLRRAVNPAAIVEALGISGTLPTSTVTTSPVALRAELANLGRPDGLRLALGTVPIPGAEAVAAQLDAVGVQVRVIPLAADDVESALEDGQVHLALVTWSDTGRQQSWRDLYGAAYTSDLFRLPVSYIAVPNLEINYTTGGWPLPRWAGS